MRRRRSTALAEERASSSQTCEREYFLGTNQFSGRRRRRMWRKISTALAEERASSSWTCVGEYSLGTHSLQWKEREEDVEKGFILHITSEAG